MGILSKIFKFFFFIVVFATLSGIVYYNRDHYEIAYHNLRQTIGWDKPCEEPIIYSIGQFDKEFGQSRTQFEGNINKAASIWNAALGKELFKFSGNLSTSTTNSNYNSTINSSDLSINLIFDSRQKNTETLNALNTDIENGKSSYTEIKAQYTSLQNLYKNQKSSLDAKIADFQNKKTAYEKNVSYWNSRGGAPKDQFEILEQQKLALNSEANSLNTITNQFNGTVNSLNTVAKQLNALGKDINQTVGTYNTVSSANGPEFQEGEYVSDEKGQRINIYQYKDYNKLIRVLTHELGHSLDMNHVADPKAIMYAYNMDSNLELTPDDVTELKRVCEVK